MSEKATKEETGTENKKSKKTLIIVIVAVLMLIVIGVGIVAFVLMSGDEKDAHAQQSAQHGTEQTAHEVQQKAAPSKPREDSEGMDSRKLSEIGVLYPLDTFTVNLKSDAGRRYLKATLSLELNGKELSLELDSKSAVIRDRIIRILTSKTLEEISSKKGKQKISEQIVDTLNSLIADGSIQAVYFTEFVIQ